MTEKGCLIGQKVENLRVVLLDGAAHSVDSSELAFKNATHGAFKEGKKYLISLP